MKKYSRWFLGLVFVMMLTLIPAGRSQAATTSNKLFDLILNDGWKAVKVPVYEVKSGSKTTVMAQKSKSTVVAYAKATKVNIAVSNKTAYYKKYYYSVRYPKSAGLSASRKIVMTAKTKSGEASNFQVLVKRPAMPKVSKTALSTTSLTLGKGKVKATISVNSSVTVKTFLQVLNSEGKTVYKSGAKSIKKGKPAYYWDGKASSGNKAGYKNGAYVKAGTYKVIIYTQYTTNGRSVYIGTGKNLTVKSSAANAAATNSSSAATTTTTTTTSTTTNAGGTSATGNTVGVNWPWQVRTTGDAELDYIAEVICQRVLTPNMSEMQRAKAILKWFNDNWSYESGNLERFAVKIAAPADKVAAYDKELQARISAGTAVMDGYDAFAKVYAATHGNVASKGLNKRNTMSKRAISRFVGSCHQIALANEILLKHAGIAADILENKKAVNAVSYPHHYWNTVRINGVWYMSDAQKVVKNRGGSFGVSHFLRGTSFMYNEAMYANVRTEDSNAYYAARSLVSAADCPGR